nr:immunoglobulin heavy chain junction region [Mus musculus]MBK4186736.1 immunoglobulin heavy chain junction region [Mus musculus]
CASDDSYFDYW